MSKREADFQTTFNQYIRKKKLYGVFELKQTKGDSLPYSDLKEHQRDGLLAATGGGFVWKFSDADSRQKPFDSMFLQPCNAYVVIKYPKFFCIINIYDFLKQEKESKRRSITSKEAEEIATVIVS